MIYTYVLGDLEFFQRRAPHYDNNEQIKLNLLATVSLTFKPLITCALFGDTKIYLLQMLRTRIHENDTFLDRADDDTWITELCQSFANPALVLC